MVNITEPDEKKYMALIAKYSKWYDDLYIFDRETLLRMFSELASECYDEGYKDGHTDM